jgi:hypothetical protein
MQGGDPANTYRGSQEDATRGIHASIFNSRLAGLSRQANDEARHAMRSRTASR